MRFAEPYWLLLMVFLPLLWRWGFGLVSGTPDAIETLGDSASLRSNQGSPQHVTLVRTLAACAFVLVIGGLAQFEGAPRRNFGSPCKQERSGADPHA